MDGTLARGIAHKRLRAAVERRTRLYLWTPADTIQFVPRVLTKMYGDGRALFGLSTINQRPAFWIIRGDSHWQTGDYRGDGPEPPDFAEFSDDILTDLEDEFGNGRCGYTGSSLFQAKRDRGCDCEQCSDVWRAKWPMVDGSGGCSWWRRNWPDTVRTVPHPFAPRTNILRA